MLAVAGALLLHAAAFLGLRPPTASSTANSVPPAVLSVRSILVDPSSASLRDAFLSSAAGERAGAAATPPLEPQAFSRLIEPVIVGPTAGHTSPDAAAGPAHPRQGPRTREPAPVRSASTPRAATPHAQPHSETLRSTAAQVREASPSPQPDHRGSEEPPTQAKLRPAPDYASGAQLDPGPRPLGDIEPHYPESANLREGTVVLRLLVSEAGALDEVAVVSADPVDVFESAALEAFSKARFSPGRVLGIPVKSQLTVEVHFMPINRGARISGRTY